MGGESTKPRVLVISFSDLTMDARIQRQVRFLSPSVDVVVAAPGAPLPGVAFHELRPSLRGRIGVAIESAARIGLRLGGQYERAYWLDARIRAWHDELASIGSIDAIIANDLYALPLALSAGGGVSVIFDSHEHWTSESASWTRWQRLSMRGAHEWIVDHAIPRTAGMMTASAGIAAGYEQRIGIRPVLVTNAPFYQALTPSPVHDPIRLLHVGYADERRCLEDMVEAVRPLGARFTLDLVLARDNAYRRRLERLVAADERIRILPGVPTSEVISFANDYDVGVFLLPATFPNQVHVLPNKLFDYIQARLAVAIGPSSEMAGIVREWDCGVISKAFSPESFSAALQSLTAARIENMKRNADRAAQVLTAEINRELVLDLVTNAVPGRAPVE